jgi:PIN domain nuclease of toxin-antitoxin system
MNLLLDTHIALWALVGDARLDAKATALILDPANEIFVSAASLWEIAIKHALRGRSGIPISATQALQYIPQAGYALLPVEARHAAAVETLPRIHADPFDWLLLAQSLIEPMHLLTHDRMLARYSDRVIRV